MSGGLPTTAMPTADSQKHRPAPRLSLSQVPSTFPERMRNRTAASGRAANFMFWLPPPSRCQGCLFPAPLRAPASAPLGHRALPSLLLAAFCPRERPQPLKSQKVWTLSHCLAYRSGCPASTRVPGFSVPPLALPSRSHPISAPTSKHKATHQLTHIPHLMGGNVGGRWARAQVPAPPQELARTLPRNFRIAL